MAALVPTTAAPVTIFVMRSARHISRESTSTPGTTNDGRHSPTTSASKPWAGATAGGASPTTEMTSGNRIFTLRPYHESYRRRGLPRAGDQTPETTGHQARKRKSPRNPGASKWRRRESNPGPEDFRHQVLRAYPGVRTWAATSGPATVHVLALTSRPGLGGSLPARVQPELTSTPSTRRFWGNARPIFRPREPWARSRFCLVGFLRGQLTNLGTHLTPSVLRRSQFAPMTN